MATSSTDGRASSRGWPLEDIPDLALAGMLGIPGEQVAARRAELAERLRDAAWVEAALEALPAATLSILQILAEGGGFGTDSQLAREAHARYGLREDLYRHAVLPAMRAVLAVPLTTRDGKPATGLVHPAAKLVVPQVIDLDAAPLPLAGFVPDAPAGADPRAVLALCIATRHFELKLNKGGDLHFGAVKRLAKQVGLDERVADRMLRVALDTKLVAADGEVVRPDAAALVAAANGHYPATKGLAALQELLAQGPIGREVAERWCARHALHDVQRIIYNGLSDLPGFTLGTVNNVPAVGYRSPEGTTSGHITPSFEVILPPESRLLDIVQIGACSDWVRLDRALVARISRPAVGRALAAGATGAQILGWLASASQHPIPQNVEVAIRDWAGAVIPAKLATGHVIVVDAAAESHALAALAKLEPRRLAPGVLVVGAEVPARELSRALVAAGIQPEADAARRRQTPPTPSARSPAGLGRPPARLRGKLAAWLLGEPFEGVRDRYLDDIPQQSPASTSGPPARLAAADPVAQIADWADAHGLDNDRAMSELLDGPLGDVLVEQPPRDLDQLLARSHDVDDLILGLAKLEARRSVVPATSPAARAPAPPSKRPPVVLSWQQEQLRPWLEAAAERIAWVALHVAGKVRLVEIEQVARRGSMWFVLGEDLADGTGVALPLDKITAIAALPDDVEIDDLLAQDHAPPPVSRPWRPAPGTAAPSGHVPCPCGSGQRYRDCCRPAAQA